MRQVVFDFLILFIFIYFYIFDLYLLTHLSLSLYLSLSLSLSLHFCLCLPLFLPVTFDLVSWILTTCQPDWGYFMPRGYRIMLFLRWKLIFVIAGMDDNL